MKNILLSILVFFAFVSVSMAQTDTGEIDRDGRIVYERVFNQTSVDIEQRIVVDDSLYTIFDHRGAFRIGTQKGYNKFPYSMFVKYKATRSLIYMTIKYEFVGNELVVTSKNTHDDLTFPVGIQYYIVVRYTKK